MSPITLDHRTLDKSSFPILIAEDDPVTRRLLETILIKAGYRVTSSENGSEALSILENAFFPIVITDWMMPNIDGLELCRLIRAIDFPGYIFIIIITANDSKDDIIAGLRAGADDYITKPFNHAELRARLFTALRVLTLERSLKQANQQIRLLSITDSLTEVYNRAFVTERLPQDLSQVRSPDRPLSLIMCDIDHFKNINDRHGHQAGDDVLKQFSRCLRSALDNERNWIARYGGEEFLVVLPETDLRKAASLAEKLRRTVNALHIPVDGHLLSFTASFGVSSVAGAENSPHRLRAETLINEADRCLYEAKHQGRNRVIISPEAY